ncbi:putative endopeptidase p60 precursor [compost metagenome]
MKKLIIAVAILAGTTHSQTCFAVPYDQYTANGDETFWSIAKKFDVDVSELQKINSLVDPENIWRGLLISLPQGHKPAAGLIPASEVSRTTYKMQAGDTFWGIAQKNRIPLSYLLEANPKVKNPHDILPGLVINVPIAPPTISPSASWEEKADYIIAVARDQFDVPYVWGGEKPWVALDCSSFTQYVYGRAGIKLPRTSNWQYQYGTYVSKDQLRKGDLVFFKEHGSKTITHVAIYLGNDLMINADTDPRDGVQLEYIFGDDYYGAAYAGAKRYF